MRAPLEDIVSRDPISVSIDPPRGYEGVRTAISLRWVEATEERPQAGVDAVINTEFRVGPKTRSRTEIRAQIADHHRDVAAELLVALKEARHQAAN